MGSLIWDLENVKYGILFLQTKRILYFREDTEVDFKKFIRILKEFYQFPLVLDNFATDDLKSQKAFLYGVAAYYFNEKKYSIAKDVLEVVVLLMEISITKDTIAADIQFVEEVMVHLFRYLWVSASRI